jgi:hypothetical protein
MNTAVITGYLQKLDKDGAAESAKVRELMAKMPKEQREMIFGCDTPQEQVVQELRALPVPEALKGLLLDAWPKNYCDTPPLEFFDTGGVVGYLEPDDFEPVVRAGFLPIGKAPNGDIVVTNFKDVRECPVGFLRLSGISSSDDEKDDISSAYHPIESSLERYLFRCVNGLALPVDSHDKWNPDELTKPLKSKPWWKFWK